VAQGESPMKIEVKLYASLARYGPEGSVGKPPQPMEAAEGTTIRELLKVLKVPAEAVKVVFLNGIHAGGEEVLKEGDRVGIFPPVAGG